MKNPKLLVNPIMGTIIIVLIITIGFVPFQIVQGIEVDKDLSLTPGEKAALDKFMQLMDPYLPHEYMKKEIYLVRWLRARNFDLVKAKEMLLQNLKWRKENKMDEILKEDWSDFEWKFKHLQEGVDKEGRPVLETDLGSWDVRSAMLVGQQNRLKRLLDRQFETVAVQIRKAQAEGKNVTQYYHIYNLDGYNLIQHSCPLCIQVLLYATSTYESHFTGSAHKVVFINTPAMFEAVSQILRVTLSPLTQEAFYFYGRNKEEWKAALYKDIEPSQLSFELGGTLTSQTDF